MLTPHPGPFGQRTPGARPGRALAALTAAVLAAHLALLAGGPPPGVGTPRAEGERRVAVWPVRVLGPMPAAGPAPAEPTARVAPDAADGPAPAPHRPPDDAIASASAPRHDPGPSPATRRAVPSGAPPPAADAPADTAPGPPTDTTHDPAGEPGPADGSPPPTYRTAPPGAAVLRYASRRGAAEGRATLSWQPEGDRWRLALQGQALGAREAGWASEGRFDAHGLAPERHVLTLRGREARAAHFRHGEGHISFSGPGTRQPLFDGAQDRVSWLVQLPAVLNADPTLGRPGSEIHLWVAGVRGDAERWVFTVVGRAPLPDLPAGPVAEAVHLLREPRRPYDTQVQVWLDPAREHLPVQAWLRVRATGEGTELRLLAVEPAPARGP